jgi:dihydropyrimidinase
MIIVDWHDRRRDEMAQLVNNGVTSFKVFMAYPGRLMLDDGEILSVMKQSRELGALVCVHAENGAAIDSLTRSALNNGNTRPIYHALTRPPAAEAEATHRAIALAQLAGAPLYIVHVTCRETLEELRTGRTRGAQVFGETCPHYLVLSVQELDRPGMEGAKFVLTPPLREPTHHEHLWQALADDTLQVVSTDHCPFDFERQKIADAGDFTRIPNGGPGIEHRLELLYDRGVLTGKISLVRWVELVSTQPARLFGLYPAKGVIAVGSDADLVVWDPGARHTISASTHHMNVDYSMFEGFSVTGRAETVIARGETIVSGGAWKGTRGRGRFVKRSPGGHVTKPLSGEKSSPMPAG